MAYPFQPLQAWSNTLWHLQLVSVAVALVKCTVASATNTFRSCTGQINQLFLVKYVYICTGQKFVVVFQAKHLNIYNVTIFILVKNISLHLKLTISRCGQIFD